MKPLLSAQYLRALASIAVVAFHTGRATILGRRGVDVFFVISGFIMWMVTIKPIGPGIFLWHRVMRVVPLYWVATLIMAVLLRGVVGRYDPIASVSGPTAMPATRCGLSWCRDGR